MNAKLSAALLATTLFACANGIDPQLDLPPDAEHGIESNDGKDDSFAIRPGSPEADAVLAYVNRDLATAAEGAAFHQDLNAVLHAWAARNIADFRAGDDGAFGTDDDRTFDTLETLDAVPWVGRAALMQLFGLAEAAGLFQRPSVDCADYVKHDRYNNYYIRSYADLLEYENARCTTVNGNVHLEITGTDLLPPQARANRNLRFLTTINGNLHIQATKHWTSLHLESLQTVTGTIQGNSTRGLGHTLDFQALTSAKSITLQEVATATFAALQHNDKIQLHDSDLEGFTALQTVGELGIYQRFAGSYNVDFPALVGADYLKLQAHRANNWTDPNIAFTGGFPKLKTVDAIDRENGRYTDLRFPKVVSIGTLASAQTVDPFVGFTALKVAQTVHSQNDTHTSTIHTGPAKLAEVANLTVTTAEDVQGYNALRVASDKLAITTRLGVTGFDALETAGKITLSIGGNRTATSFGGFNALTYADSVYLEANLTAVALGASFGALETTGQLTVGKNNGFSDNIEFASLLGVEGPVFIDTLHDTAVDIFPVLEIVDGKFSIESTPQQLRGMDQLERIEGSLSLKRVMNEIAGLSNLSAVGGNLSLPRTLPQPALDNFVLQLDEFSGTITYN